MLPIVKDIDDLIKYCIDLKVGEGVPVREVSNIESTTEDTTETKDEQVQESYGEETPR
jgi:hypothetical protein